MKKLIDAKDPPEEPFDTELVSSDDERIEVKAIHRRDGLAQTHRLPAALFKSTEYRRLVEVHADLLKQVGRPPFTLALKERTKEAESFAELRRAVLELARHGVTMQRFKGLGEMNADQLRETTMDPESRTLQRVTIEDGAARRAHLRRPHGRQGRAAEDLHREARQGSAVPRCLARRRREARS